MCEDCFAAIITVASIFWIEYLLFEPPRYGGSFFVARFDAARRDTNSIYLSFKVRQVCWLDKHKPFGHVIFIAFGTTFLDYVVPASV